MFSEDKFKLEYYGLTSAYPTFIGKYAEKNNDGKMYDYSVIVQGSMIELWTDHGNMAKFLSKIPGVSYVSRCDGNFYNIFVDKRYVVGRVAEAIAEWLETKLWTSDSRPTFD